MRDREADMFQCMLVAVDGSEPSDRAIDLACELAAKHQAKLAMIHVLQRSGLPTTPEELKAFAEAEHIRITEAELIDRAGQTLLEQGKRRAAAAGCADVETILEHGDPATQIVNSVRDRNVDLVVMGRRGRSDLVGLLLGSVSHKVSQLAPCACLTIK
jgi:nucleotide-binding universal stress UspA family protein